jgi:ABC-type polysaccharide/polyol phosphate export permease
MLSYLALIWRCRNFWFSLVVNDLQLRYRRSALGVGWSLLHPLAYAVVLGAAFHEIFHQPIREYLPYLLCGLACWGFLTGAATDGCSTYINAENYIRQHPLPLAVYPLRTALGAMIHFLIALALVGVLKLALQGMARPPEPFSLTLGVLLVFLFGWSVAVLAAYVNVAFRDTQHLLGIVLQIWFYLSPIIYPAQSLASTRFGWVVAFNPLTPFLDVVRVPMLEGRPPSLACYGAALAIVAAVAGAAALSLGRQQRQVIFYL